MELDQLFPEKPVFVLKNVEHTLRLPNLEDSVWLKNHIGDEKALSEMFTKLDWANICKFVYRLLVNKEQFQAFDETVIDDNGERVTRRVSGPDRLLREISGQEEGARILGALTKAIAMSNPMVNDHVEAQKKSLLNGLKSSTDLQASTVGP